MAIEGMIKFALILVALSTYTDVSRYMTLFFDTTRKIYILLYHLLNFNHGIAYLHATDADSIEIFGDSNSTDVCMLCALCV